MSNSYGVNVQHRAFNANDEGVIRNASAYLQEHVAPNMADFKGEQRVDLNDTSIVDNIPGMEEYVAAFGPFFPQVAAIRFSAQSEFVDAIEWGYLETLTELLPAISFGIRHDKINLSDLAMVQFGEMLYRKGKQVATGTLELRDEKDEAGQA